MACRLVAACLIVLLLAVSSASAGAIEDGVAAMDSGDFSAAFEYWNQAEDHWRPLAEQGDAEGQFKLGVMHLNGYGVEQDEAEALRLIRTAAEKGHPEAQTVYGYLHFEGQLVPQDYGEAAVWIRKAADQGFPEAQAILGLMYDGIGMLGVPYDREKAIELFRKAADKGVGVAQFQLSRKYLIGAGVPKDETIAFEWLSRAAVQGFAEAQYELGQYYYFGFFNTPKNETLGCFWSSAAAQQGYEGAQQSVDLFCGYLFTGLIGETMDRIDQWTAGRPRPAGLQEEKPTSPPAPP